MSATKEENLASAVKLDNSGSFHCLEQPPGDTKTEIQLSDRESATKVNDPESA